jgi:hypothetical protein
VLMELFFILTVLVNTPIYVIRLYEVCKHAHSYK